MKKTLLLSAIALSVPALHAASILDNGSFETTPASFVQDFDSGNIVTYYDVDAAAGDATNRIDGWQTTASDERIEIWNNDNSIKPTIKAFEGNNYAEINANEVAELFQEVVISNGDVVDYVFYHRGRDLATEQLTFRITDLGVDGIFNGYDGAGLAQGDDTQKINLVSTAGTTAWVTNFGNDVFTSNGNKYRFGFETVTGTTNSATEGNFLDAQAFGEAVADDLAAVPEPSSSMLILLSGAALLGRRKKSQ